MTPSAYAPPPIVQALGKGSSIVEAAAGTGKTWTIEQLVADQLLTHGLPLHRVLVVTFTRKAAGELTERIRGQLQSLLRSPSATESERTRLLDALRHFDQAQISTIHSFCQRVLTDHAVLANHLPSHLPPPLSLARQAYRNCLRRDFFADEEARRLMETLAWSGYSAAELEKVLEECARSRATLVPRVSSDGILEAWAAVTRLLDKHGREMVAHFKGNASRVKLSTEHLVEGYRHVPADNPWNICFFIVDWFKAATDTFDPPKDYRTQAALQAKPPSRTSRSKQPENPALGAHFEALAEAFETLLPLLPSREAIIATVLAPKVQAEVERLRREGGHLDHDGLLSATRDALSGPHKDALISALRKSWAVALVDEFQDTDEVQWELLRAVFLDERNRQRLIAVGDPKQAIYGFRGGDVLTYVTAAKDIEAIGTRQPLDGNYRSSTEYVAAVNALFESSSQEKPFFRNEAVQYRPVKAMDGNLSVSGLPEPLRPFQLVCLPAGIGNARAQKAARLGFLVKTVQALIDAGRKGATWSKTEGGQTRTRTISPSDVLCLTMTNRESREVAAHLRAAGIATALYREPGLLSGPEAADILDVLTALADPSDSGLRRRAWLTPFFDARFDQLRDAELLTSDHPLNLRFHDWVQKAASRDWEGLFSAMLRGSGLNRRLLFVPGGERELINYETVLDLLRNRARDGHDGLADLVLALDTWKREFAARPDDGDTHQLPSDAEAVRVLTVHKAKGLQAPFVYLHFQAKGDDKGHVHIFHEDGERYGWVGDADKEHDAKIEETRIQEQLRTFYVGLTRARFVTWLPFLVPVPGHEGLYAEQPSGQIKLLMDAFADRIVNVTGFMNHCDVRVAEPAPKSPPAQRPPWIPPATAKATAPVPAFSKLREERKGLMMKSYSSLSGKVDPGKQPAEKPTLPKADPTKVPRGKTMGTYVHTLLEELPTPRVQAGETLGDWLRRDRIADYWAKVAANTSLKGPQLEDAQQLVFRGYGTPLQLPSDGGPLAGLGTLATFQPEVEFRFPFPESHHPRLGSGQVPPRWTVERGHLKGFMDFVFTDTKRRLYFGDWKTNTLLDYAPATIAADVEAHYREQIRIYTLALCRAAGIRTEPQYEERFGGFVYVYLRDFRADGHGLCTGRVEWAELQDFEQKLWAYKLPPEDRTPSEPTSAGEEETSEENEREEEP